MLSRIAARTAGRVRVTPAAAALGNSHRMPGGPSPPAAAGLRLSRHRSFSTTPAAAAASPAAQFDAFAAETGVKFFLVSFLDLFGVQRAKLVPASAIGATAEGGAGFAGFAAHFDACPSQPDVLAIPDPNSLIQLPWKKDVAWCASNLFMSGAPLAQCPRTALVNAEEKLKSEHQMLYKTGVECEWMLIEPPTAGRAPRVADGMDTATKCCYHQVSLMRNYDLIAKLTTYMDELGWGPYQADHEDANGQFELNWEFDTALVTADRQAFFKFMVKTLAEEQGDFATFMPKPFTDKTGNGMHLHVTLHDEHTESNLFKDPDGELGLSTLATRFIGGLIDHVPALCAFGNPTVNSYKRISAPAPTSGATWAPSLASWGGNDRTHTIRVPDAPRLEFRLGDMAAHPYLWPTATLAAGMDGITSEIDTAPHAKGAAWDLAPGTFPGLPTNLLDAVRGLEADATMSGALGSELTAAYGKLRMQQWSEYSRHMTQYELDTYLDV